MHAFQRWSVAILMATAISSPALLSGCGGHVRVYDSYYHDYHPWNRTEVGFYTQWEGETHRDHVEFAARTPEDQHAYWDWRHKH
jgi:hypothetical protein